MRGGSKKTTELHTQGSFSELRYEPGTLQIQSKNATYSAVMFSFGLYCFCFVCVCFFVCDLFRNMLSIYTT
jgi:hypothetical protein